MNVFQTYKPSWRKRSQTNDPAKMTKATFSHWPKLPTCRDWGEVRLRGCLRTSRLRSRAPLPQFHLIDMGLAAHMYTKNIAAVAARGLPKLASHNLQIRKVLLGAGGRVYS